MLTRRDDKNIAAREYKSEFRSSLEMDFRYARMSVSIDRSEFTA